MKNAKILLPESHGQNSALTVLQVPSSLDIGTTNTTGMYVPASATQWTTSVSFPQHFEGYETKFATHKARRQG